VSVLGKKAIDARFSEIFPSRGRRENVKAAKYYLTLSGDFLIVPNGTRYRPPESRATRFVVQPGQTAFVSTVEHITMPHDLIGIIGPRFNSAENGILFFGGMLVDPGYGFQGTDEGPGEPLSFNIANVGNTPLELRPGKDEIASIAFFEVTEPLKPVKLRSEFPVTNPEKIRSELFHANAGKTERPTGTLGVIEDVRQMRADVDKLKASVNQVVLFGVVVLAATLFAAVVAAILGFASSNGAVNPSLDSGEILETIGLALGVGVVLMAVIVIIFYALVPVGAKMIGLSRRRNLGE
jgi:deoxycytidine triphosphate deaminase